MINSSSYEYLLELSDEELQKEAKETLEYYNTILIVIGGNIAEQAFFGDLSTEGNKDD